MSKIYVEVTSKLVIEGDDKTKIDIDEIIAEMDYNFTSKTKGAEIIDTEIRDYKITFIVEQLKGKCPYKH